MGQKEVKNENYCGVFEMRDLARFFSEVLKLNQLSGRILSALHHYYLEASIVLR
jgi:hypothetical protein